jgi:hypothetical protein
LRDTRAALRKSRPSARPLAAVSSPDLAAATSGCLGRSDSGLLHVERASLATSASPQSRQRRPRARAQYASRRDRPTFANTMTVSVPSTASAPPSTIRARDRRRSQPCANVRRVQHREHYRAARAVANPKMLAATTTALVRTITPIAPPSVQRLRVQRRGPRSATSARGPRRPRAHVTNGRALLSRHQDDPPRASSVATRCWTAPCRSPCRCRWLKRVLTGSRNDCFAGANLSARPARPLLAAAGYRSHSRPRAIP